MEWIMSFESENSGQGHEITNAGEKPKPLTLFYSYSHKDEALREKLEEQLAVLRRRGLITAWHDREIIAGEDWKGKIDERLDSADIILLLVSPSFLASDYCWDREMTRALERHDLGEAQVIPVILRPCLWQEGPFAKLQAVPKDARPVTQWQDADEAFFNVASAIRLAIEELQLRRLSVAAPLLTEPPASVPPSTHSRSSDIPPTASASEGRVYVGAELRALPDLAVFKDIDAPWCPEMVALPAGEFMMGAPDTGEGEEYAKPQRRVEISYRLAIGRYPVMFDEYDHFCAAAGRRKPEDRGWGRGRRPVINVNWKDAKAYCEWLARETGKPYRLPTEPEWEYACRAGTITRYAFGDSISKAKARYGLLAWSTVEVGRYRPNLWGLFDMHGNVWEWVEDVYRSYSEAPCDGSPQLEGKAQDTRVVRGGSFRCAESSLLRSYFRNTYKYMESEDDLGFRVAQTL
jgi:formylglycine-generating enzyme required for sulfatase activity